MRPLCPWRSLLVGLFLAPLAAASAFAQSPPPSQLQLQARLADSAGNPLSGPVTVEVRIYDAAVGGSLLFNEVQTPTALNGVVSLVVGSINVPASNLFDGATRFLALKVGADAEMTPRRPIVSVPFATRSASTAALTATTTIPAGLVTSAHILDGTILGADIAADSIVAAHLASNAVTGSKVLDGSIALAKLAANSVDASKIVDGSVGAAEIAAGAVTLAKLAADSVDGSRIVNGSITSADLAAGAVGATTLAAGSVGSAAILDGSILLIDLAANSVDASKIVDGSVGAAELAAGSVTLAKIAQPLASAAAGAALTVQSSSTSGIGVVGEATAASGTVFGVRGEIANTTGAGAGLIGEAATGNACDGVRGLTASASGYGVWGQATSATGTAFGIRGESSSTSGTGAFGRASATTGATTGVRGDSSSTTGTGVLGQNTTATGATFGVRGIVNSTSGIGVLGDSNATSGLAFGVTGFTSSQSAMGVYGRNLSTSAGSGVMGESGGTDGVGVEGKVTGTGSVTAVIGLVWGAASNGTGVFGGVIPGGIGDGVVGDASSSAFDAVRAEGDFTATGFKSFSNPHPNDPSKEIRFVCLEGNESGTYFRGTAKLSAGVAVIQVPEEFRLVSESAGITVQITPIGKAQLWCESKSLDRVVVGGDRDVEFDYFVNGVRRGYSKFEPIRNNRSYVPRYRDVPFGTQYPDDIRAILVANGVLNADFTPNTNTAEKLGWRMRTLAEAHPDLSSAAASAREANRASRDAASTDRETPGGGR